MKKHQIKLFHQKNEGEKDPSIPFSADNIPDLVKETMSSKDLSKFASVDIKESVGDFVKRVLCYASKGFKAVSIGVDFYIDISDAFFFRKFNYYLYGLAKTTDKQRNKFMGDVEKAAEDTSENVLMGMISRIDNIHKSKILANLTRARINNEISIEDFFRISTVVERVPYPDFKYLPEFTQRNYLPGGVSELLLSAGALSQMGIDGNGDHDWFELSPIGTKLMKYGLEYNIEVKDKTKIELPEWELADDMVV